MAWIDDCFRVVYILMLVFVLTSSFDSILQDKLEKISGVYVDVSKRYNPVNVERVVVITSCNHGFINHLHNFKCFLDRLGIKFLVMSMDHKIHEYIESNTSMTSYLMKESVVGNITMEVTEYRSKQFNLITVKKIEAVHMILLQGYDVLFADVDVAIVQDPIPLVMFPNIDYSHSVNWYCEK